MKHAICRCILTWESSNHASSCNQPHEEKRYRWRRDLRHDDSKKDNMFVLESCSMGMDPNIIYEPDTFDPTIRWFDDQVKNWRGTPAQVPDHTLYRGPFSARARKCPGSRVAKYEAKILLSQLVLDRKIALAVDNRSSIKSSSDNGKATSWRDIPYFQGLLTQSEISGLYFEKQQ